MADHHRVAQPLHHHHLLPVFPFPVFQQSHHMLGSRTGYVYLHYTPAYPPVFQRYNWIRPEQVLIDGHICTNGLNMFQVPWEDEPEHHQHPPSMEESSRWYSPDEETAILELDGDYSPDAILELDTDYSPAPPNDGFSEETISDHIKTRTHQESGNQETDICVVCQSEYEEGENLGRLRCGHEYHADCIGRWLLLRKCCPVCKRTA